MAMSSFRAAGLATVLTAAASVGPLAAQTFDLPLSPNRPRGQGIAPYFEGWYANDDGTFTFSLGYFNFNTDEAVYIPIGPDNRIEPAEFDGLQPEYFENLGGRDRKQVGVFGVRVPADFADGNRRLLWTLTRNGKTFSVPAYVGVEAYQLSHAGQAMGSVPPRLKLAEDGQEGIGPGGVWEEGARTARVGRPLALAAWATDPSVRGGRNVTTEVPVVLSWWLHQGDGRVRFRPEGRGGAAESEEAERAQARRPPNEIRLPSGGGSGTILATFEDPGEYVLRVRADNFAADDSRTSDQCCWTNGFVRVIVSP
jgi:hypothetical protein